MSRRLLPLAALLTLGVAVAPAAHAAYAPKIAITVDPATPFVPAAITSTVTQGIGETASKTVKVAFPVGFSSNPAASTAPVCSPDQEATGHCPDPSQVGTASATASVGVVPINLDGTVHFGGTNSKGIKLIVFLRNSIIGDQTIEGYVQIRPDGGFDTTFDGLPNVLTTAFTLKLDGGDKALSLTPQDCGDYTFNGTFTSQNGEQATSSSKVTIGGCTPKKLSVLNLDLAKSSVSFNLTTAASGTVSVRKGKTRVVLKRFTGKRGANTVKLGKTLKPGRYRVSVDAKSPDGQEAVKGRTETVTKSS